MAVSISISITQNSQSIPNNTSNVTVKVTAKWTYGSYNLTNKSGWLKIDGTKYTFTNSFNNNQTTSGTKTLFTKTVNVAHNSDGSKTLSCSASYTSGVSSGTVTASASKALTKIARKSSISAVDASALGSASTITVSQQNSSFTHTITYECGTASGTVCTKSSSTSVSWTPPISLAAQNTTGTSLTITFTIETFNGTTSIGTNTWTSYAYSIPLDHADIKPTLTLAVADKYSYRGTYGAYVQGKSQLVITMTSGFKQGATIKSYKTTIDGKTYTDGPSLTTDVLTGSGDKTITVVMTDSRGGTVTSTWDIEILAYAIPKLVSPNVKRTDSSGTASSSGAYLTVSFGSSVSALNNKNTAAYKVQYKKTSETSYTTVTLSDYANNYAVSGGTYTFAADTASTYDVILTVTDGVSGSDSKQMSGSSISKVWSILAKGKGLALGKVAELSGYFEVAWQSLFRNHVGVGNKQSGTDGKTGAFIHKDGIVYIQRDDSQGYHPYLAFLIGDETSVAGTIRTNCNSRYMEFLSAQGYRFGNKTILQNNKFLFSEDSDGTERNLFGLNDGNNLLIGWDLYDKSLGNCVLYGNNVRLNAKEGFYITSPNAGLSAREYGVNKVLWSGVSFMTDEDTATLTEAISAQPNGIIVVWSYYNNSAAQNYNFHEFFIPKYMVSAHSGCGHYNFLTNNANTHGAKYLYISDTKIVGNTNNDQSITSTFLTYANARWVMRYVIGV